MVVVGICTYNFHVVYEEKLLVIEKDFSISIFLSPINSRDTNISGLLKQYLCLRNAQVIRDHKNNIIREKTIFI